MRTITLVGAHRPHGHGHVHLDEGDWEALAVDAELEGELLLGFVTDTARWIDELRGPDAPPVRRVLDIGSGPGVGTCELARRFPDAHVIAVDGSPAMLERATDAPLSTASMRGQHPPRGNCPSASTISIPPT